MTRQGRRLILVPLDGSRAAAAALSVARALSHPTGAVLHALHVCRHRLPPEQLAAALGMPPEYLSDVILDQAVGQPEQQIPRTASALGAELVVIATHGRSHDLGRVAGHVTLSVIQGAACPVLVIRSALGPAGAEKLSRVRRILVPLDGLPQSTACVGHAVELARWNDAELCFLHVATVPREPSRRRAMLSAPRYLDQPYLEMEAWSEEFMARCLCFEREARLDVPLHLFLSRGEPAAEIVRFATEHACDLIVVAWGCSLDSERATVVKSLLERAPSPLLFLRAPVSESQDPVREGADTQPRRATSSPSRLP